MHLIAVIMGAPTRDIRNEEAKKLLDYGFANYALYTYENDDMGSLPMLGGVSDLCKTSAKKYSVVLDKNTANNIVTKVEMPEKITAPVKVGDKVGSVRFFCGENLIGETDVVSAESIAKISYWEIFMRILKGFMITK
jgi:D-alanyl-D-alanine carboxypeptidase (penicillin-binding protein 5/6)